MKIEKLYSKCNAGYCQRVQAANEDLLALTFQLALLFFDNAVGERQLRGNA